MRQHQKLRSVKDKSQAIYDFLEWLSSKGIGLGTYTEDSDFYQTVSTSPRDLLAEHFEIDLEELEREKLAMLAEIRGD